jgi:hypothetical protein
MASFNNRKQQLTVGYTSGKKLSVHYSHLGIRAPITRVWIDSETKGCSLGIELENGRVDYMPYDQPLSIARDPEFLLQTHIELLIAHIKEQLQEKKISKRYLAEQLHTSDNQIQRLLNPAILNKNLFQLYRIAALAGLELELKAA